MILWEEGVTDELLWAPSLPIFLFRQRYARMGIVQTLARDTGERWKENPRPVSLELEHWLESTWKLEDRD